MRKILSSAVLVLLFSTQLFAEELSVELRFTPVANSAIPENIVATVKGFRGVRIHSFSDKRATDDNFLGETRVNGRLQKMVSKTALSVYATEGFKKVYSEWGGKISDDGPLSLKGEITQFLFEESDGYQAKIGFHFYLLDDSGRTLWDGHSSGIVRGAGKTIGSENISALFNDILRATYLELLEDNKLVGVWSGRVSNTYVIRSDAATSSASAKNPKQ